LKFPKLIQREPINIEGIVCKEFQGEDIGALFDGKHSIEDIYADLLAKGVGFETINSLFKALLDKQLLVDKINLESALLSDEDLDVYSAQIATFSIFNQQYTESKYQNLTAGLLFQERVASFSVAMMGESPLIKELLLKLKGLGVKNIYQEQSAQEIPPAVGLLIYAPEEYGEAEMIELTEYCYKKDIALFPIFKTSFGMEFGPIHIPHDTSCYQCLINRKKSVLGEGYENIYKDTLHFNFPLGGDVVLLEAIKYITGITPVSLRNRILQHNYINGIFTFHPVLKIPGCAICGNNFKPKRKLWEEIV
jgi:hypothetical protein